MGFYSPATLVKDAQRHGVDVRPIDIAHSHWACSLERDTAEPTPGRRFRRRSAVRLGLRYAAGLHRESGEAIAAARARAPFRGVADLTKRVALRRDALDTLAELGALASIDPAARTRRGALWQVAALERDPSSLFAGQPPAEAASPLPEMTALEVTLADYRCSGITTGPQMLASLRPALRERGALTADELHRVPDGRFVRVAGHVIVRQRPGTAKGFCFLTLEDETGTANAILTPKEFQRFRVPLHEAKVVLIAGPLQNVDDVIHVRVRHLEPLVAQRDLPGSHDYR
jgi:error-prone DNA polymerase